ncbi:galactosyl transferase [Basidiobolus meristosporus CBS 931.73]|uniref:Galactosyl transferase n=1 Tax=Basidiobolus meristosporus CBS 931.73 TaxID=1314790 RepID=A0A1Y1XR06_9FUNG|nr:galactosyl transferase [Basidiobolus meristosporus CBS 931.73]|eukprot:ORX88173.1 galactosyl transferase [Basidiobolus meristosporus CBS 931.73]
MGPDIASSQGKLRPSEIAVVMAYDEKESHYLPRSRDNKEEYARKHGYKFLQDGIHDKSRGAVSAWGKIVSLRKYMKMYPNIKWFWWIDVDTVLMDPTIALEDHILGNLTKPEYSEKDMVISYDCNGLNAGSFLIRNSPWSQNFLATVYSPQYSTRFGYAEQGTMQHLFETSPDVAEHFYFVPQNLINAFPIEACGDEDYVHSYKEGDLIIHFAGCWIQSRNNCKERFDEYWERRIPAFPESL